MKFRYTLSPEYKRSFTCGALVVFVVLFLASGFDHDPVTTQITLMAALGYFGGVAVVAIRRPQAPTLADLWLMRWGYIPLWLAAQFLVRDAWIWMGRLR